jgi:hypothetical protein
VSSFRVVVLIKKHDGRIHGTHINVKNLLRTRDFLVKRDSVGSTTVISIPRTERETFEQFRTGLKLLLVLGLTPVAFPDVLDVVPCLSDIFENSHGGSVHMSMSNTFFALAVIFALERMDMIGMVAFLTGMKKASEKLVHRVGSTIVTVHLLFVKVSRRFGKRNLVFLVVFRMLNEDVVGDHEVFHPFDGNGRVIASFGSCHILDGILCKITTSVHSIIGKGSDGHKIKRIHTQILLTVVVFQCHEIFTKLLHTTTKYVHIRETILMHFLSEIENDLIRDLLIVPHEELLLIIRLLLHIPVPFLIGDRTHVILERR